MAPTPPPHFHFSPRPNLAGQIAWQEFGEASFDTARRAGRPLLLSLSATWCHWCHVMDETTYSAPEVQRLIAERFVAVRVDRDQRPDVDRRYNMGGWPTVAFLTPEGQVLTGATYLPAESMLALAGEVADYYQHHRAELEASLAELLTGRSEPVSSKTAFSPELAQRLVAGILERHDEVHGGFGEAPKFPQADALSHLAELGLLGDERCLKVARRSLEAMHRQGLFDPLEGGFFRYSTVRDWTVPHFEKMLEDHAGLLEALALAGEEEIFRAAVGYLDRTLRNPEGHLYGGSQDADEAYYRLDLGGRAAVAPPAVDRRVFVSWNASLASALELASSLFADRDLHQKAQAMRRELWAAYRAPDGTMLHTLGVGGLLEDQAWMLLLLARSGREQEGTELLRALERTHLQEGAFADRTDEDASGLLRYRLFPQRENAVIAIALNLLGERDRALDLLQRTAPGERFDPLGAALWGRAHAACQREVVKVTTGNDELAASLLRAYPYALHERAGDERAILCLGRMCLSPTGAAQWLIESLRSWQARGQTGR